MSDAVELGLAGRAVFAALEPGLADPVHGSQSCFRAVLAAMARPGTIVEIPPALAGNPLAPLGPAAAAIALTLCDIDTPVWLDAALEATGDYLRFHCGAPLAARPNEARFAFVAELSALPPLGAFALGSDEYPEQSTTLVIEAACLVGGTGVRLRGPGIQGEARLGIAGLPARFWEERQALAELFPRGVDVLFISGHRLAALPRSSLVAA